ncbi:leukocyte immunoglobulin-like receptor subfamily A member 5 isoform X3 [Alexandromys fortis]|uniref:leukocyte immunoglobulin-like receptor subfamily A member 5 isoform X3 n=1 Tax=Alexandromys fortis TaxID=100897 RepID=UPI002153816B|nr:leukocyte immunoglobulin-like receptor subfamily A member 5 isoform X3 [Microtus fortis]
MIFTFTVFFHLGLSLEPRRTVVAEKLQKPTIWAEPDSVVTKGLSVYIFCFGTQEVQKYYLYKKERLNPLKIQTSLEPGNKANFSIPFITEYHAGLYYCCYFSPSNLSECSDILELVVTGFYNKPNISALPSSLVTSGGNVTLQCSSHQGYERYILTKEGEQNVSWTQDSQKQPNGHFMALFPVGPVTSKHRWAFRCYGYYERTSQMWSMPSETLQLLLIHTHKIIQWRISSGWLWLTWFWWFLGFYFLRHKTVREVTKIQDGELRRRAVVSYS